MELRTRIRERGVAPDGILLEGESFIPGGYYNLQNELITIYSKEPSFPLNRRDYIAKQRAEREEFSRKIQAPGVHYKKGKNLLVLDYAYEPDENVNVSFSAGKEGIFYIQGVVNRILGCEFAYYYYKITCNYPGMVDANEINSILEKVCPDYILIIGFDLFNRLPIINGKGPNLVTPNGYAQTYTVWDAGKSRSVLCLPLPHPKTPGFDSEVEKIWHNVIVELFKH